MPHKPFPLDWPSNHPRTSLQSASRFQVRPVIAAAKAITQRLQRMRFADIVISSNMPIRRDGLPYASGREPGDTGVAVWWRDKAVPTQGDRVIACDRWITVHENLHAIELSLDAMAGLNRWGASQIVEQVFAGFAALPSPDRELAWRDVLGNALTYEDAKRLYRAEISKHHPDHGGTVESAARINAAWAQCELEWQERAYKAFVP
jgi:hypothetical protein